MLHVDPRWPRHAAVAAVVVARLVPGELAHDASHLHRVYAWCLRLAGEAHADAELCGAAALLHDLSCTPKDSPERALGGERSALLADAVLADAGYDDSARAAITAAVATSSWSRGLAPANAIGIALQDADRLDALGAVGLLRTIACGQHVSRADQPGRFYDPEDPFAETGRPLDDRRQCLDHLFAKLLKLSAGMHTPTARTEAARRHAFLLATLDQLRSELAADLPASPG